ncbi:ankyrin repeat domain-containing protein [Macrococcus armenti]|uniref:ankyrin repeat domain-containing protein n=1 Tax=Macrococcus armenti TaxID=2875764 RepID=UPI001CCFC509|nr:ankyrin repeat domain-containing protein [Macrococcus armenti]UBH07737.1 ankyrin repeat domain-containing protein [Macrococcus armenti]UBH09972.1 ankyrin repeat domain-containing protein [Macrococcus armenti]
MEKINIKENYKIVREGTLDDFISLIKKNPNILENIFMNETIIYYAISCNRLDILEYVITNQLIDINFIPENNDDNLLSKALRTRNKKIALFLINNDLMIDRKNVQLSFYYQFDYEFIKYMLKHASKEYIPIFRKNALEFNREDVLNLIDNKYIHKNESLKLQSSDIILNFLKNSSDSMIELPNGVFELSTKINRDIHIKGDGKTKLKAAKQEGIFQIDGHALTLENLILEAEEGFLIPVYNGKLNLKNCKIIIDEIGIVSENSAINLIDCEMIRPYNKNNAYSVMKINTTDLNIINSNIDVNLAVASVEKHCKVSVENSNITGNQNFPLFYSKESMDIMIYKSHLYNAHVGIQTKSNSKIVVKNSNFEGFYRAIYSEDGSELKIKNSKFRKATSNIQIGKNCSIAVEDCIFSYADENHVTVDQKSVLNVKRSKFDNANMAALSGLKDSEINIKDSEILSTISGIVTQGGKLNVSCTKFIKIDDVGAIRGVKNDEISLKDVIIDSSLTDIIVDNPRKLIQENVKITNPVTIDNLE